MHEHFDLAKPLVRLQSKACLTVLSTKVRNSLGGQRLGRFTRPKAAAVAALKDAVLRVLTPRKATDLLHEVRN